MVVFPICHSTCLFGVHPIESAKEPATGDPCPLMLSSPHFVRDVVRSVSSSKVCARRSSPAFQDPGRVWFWFC